MTDHPLTETRAAELWDAHRDEPGLLPLHAQGNRYMENQVSMLRAAYDAGREDVLNPFDPLAENNGKVIRDVEMDTGYRIDVAILAGPRHLLADWSPGVKSYEPSGITAFTTDDRSTRYTRHVESGIWTAVTLNGDTND